jgi:hypothetical protein
MYASAMRNALTRSESSKTPNNPCQDKFDRFEAWLRENGGRFDQVNFISAVFECHYWQILYVPHHLSRVLFSLSYCLSLDFFRVWYESLFSVPCHLSNDIAFASLFYIWWRFMSVFLFRSISDNTSIHLYMYTLLSWNCANTMTAAITTPNNNTLLLEVTTKASPKKKRSLAANKKTRTRKCEVCTPSPTFPPTHCS